MGSGSTGCACVNLGFEFTGIELDEESFWISLKRIKHFKNIQETNRQAKGYKGVISIIE